LGIDEDEEHRQHVFLQIGTDLYRSAQYVLFKSSEAPKHDVFHRRKERRSGRLLFQVKGKGKVLG